MSTDLASAKWYKDKYALSILAGANSERLPQSTREDLRFIWLVTHSRRKALDYTADVFRKNGFTVKSHPGKFDDDEMYSNFGFTATKTGGLIFTLQWLLDGASGFNGWDLTGRVKLKQ